MAGSEPRGVSEPTAGPSPDGLDIFSINCLTVRNTALWAAHAMGLAADEAKSYAEAAVRRFVLSGHAEDAAPFIDDLAAVGLEDLARLVPDQLARRHDQAVHEMQARQGGGLTHATATLTPPASSSAHPPMVALDDTGHFLANCEAVKATARWVAASVGLEGEDAGAYVHDIMVRFMTTGHPGDGERFLAGLAGRDYDLSAHRIEGEFRRQLEVAERDVRLRTWRKPADAGGWERRRDPRMVIPELKLTPVLQDWKRHHEAA